MKNAVTNAAMMLNTSMAMPIWIQNRSQFMRRGAPARDALALPLGVRCVMPEPVVIGRERHPRRASGLPGRALQDRARQWDIRGDFSARLFVLGGALQ